MSIIQERKTSDFHWEKMPVLGCGIVRFGRYPTKA